MPTPGAVSVMLMLFYGLPPRVLNCTPAFDTASASLNNIPTKRRNVARCRIAPLATLGRPEISRLIKVNHYYVARAHNYALGWMRGILSEH